MFLLMIIAAIFAVLYMRCMDNVRGKNIVGWSLCSILCAIVLGAALAR